MISFRQLSAIVTFFSLLAGDAHAQDEITFERPEAGAGAPLVLGGAPANPKEWPATYSFSSSGGRCTSTIIGSKVILTAAHCIGDGARGRLRTASGDITVFCTHHPRYSSDYQYDLALCVATREIPATLISHYETINTDPRLLTIGDDVTLLGFGCRQEGGGGPSGVLYQGQSTLNNYSGIYLVTSGGAAVCFGDSGGSAYMMRNAASRRVIGVNSRGDISTRSLLTPIANAGIIQFIDEWSIEHNVSICGFHDNVDGCQP